MSRFNTFTITDKHRVRIAEHLKTAIALTIGHNLGADVSQWCGSVFNQLQQGSCTACTARDYLWWLQNRYGYPIKTDPSVDGIYYFGRKIYGDLTVDGGATVTDSFAGTVQYGVIPTADWQYNETDLFAEPPLTDVAWKAKGATVLTGGTAAIRASLDAGIPVGISVEVDDILFNPTLYNGMYLVDVGTSTGEGHAVFDPAYKPDPVHEYLYKFQNSWDTTYGDNGFAWFTEASLKKNLMEVVQLDIPKPVEQPYKLGVTFASDNVAIGAHNQITLTTTLNGKPVPNQTVNWSQARPGMTVGSDTGTWTTDAAGTWTGDVWLTEAGALTVTLSWQAPDGVTRTATASAKWGAEPAPKPTPPPVPKADYQVVIGPFDTLEQAQAAKSSVTKAFHWVPKVEEVPKK